MGTPAFARTALDALAIAGHEIACVYSQPPRPAGRGQHEARSAVHMRALELGLPVRHPASLKGPEAQAEFAALDLDVAVVAAYGLLLPQPVLDAPRRGCLNIHASLLPRWRGAAPIQRAIEAGDPETGITIMRMEAGLDTGPMLLKRVVPIGPAATAGSLHDELATAGGEAIVEALARLDTLAPEIQGEGATYARKLDKGEARLDWSQPAEMLARRVRAFDPFPGTWFGHGDERIKVLAARAVAGPAGAPGTVMAAPLVIACGSGALEIMRVQRAGRAPMDAEAFLRGHALVPGTVLAS
ncbi:MAG: methionyl-tRNA formyltransferase [Rhodospirillales bacterium]|nr:methionyl-tRNA formyltransferase [Rhodospirillales bacterium]